MKWRLLQDRTAITKGNELALIEVELTLAPVHGFVLDLDLVWWLGLALEPVPDVYVEFGLEFKLDHELAAVLVLGVGLGRALEPVRRVALKRNRAE